LGLTQQRLAELLGLDATYLSQLENGHRRIDDWWVEKIKDLAASNFGFPNIVQSNPVPEAKFDDLNRKPVSKETCMAYLARFLDQCDSPAKLGWAYYELQERFPLRKWAKSQIRHDDEFAASGQKLHDATFAKPVNSEGLKPASAKRDPK
jgi:transcriptional regulator with XRE-family HTH domain